MRERELPGDARYVVTAALIVVRCGPDGAFHHLYRGAHVPATVDPPQLDMLLSSGMITRRDDR